MKQVMLTIIIAALLSTVSCHGQKIVQTISDAKKLELNKDQFIGKPLKALLAQIMPKIKFAYGNPDNTWGGQTTYIKLFFVDKDEIRKRIDSNDKATGITISFQLEPENKRKSIPVGGIAWGEEQVKDYGDMIIARIYVSGNN